MKHIILRSLFFIIIFIFSFVNLTYAQLDTPYFDRLKTEKVLSESDISWTQIAPGNAGFSDLVRYHPTNPDVILFVPDLWVVYRSIDNGTTWHNVKDKDGNGEFERLRDMYFSSHDENFGLGLESSQLWQTNDMGASWQLVENCGWYENDTDGSDRTGWKSKNSAVALDPTNNTHWYVGAGKNPRGQIRWSEMRFATAENPRGKANAFAGKIWFTKDAGATWRWSTAGINPSAEFNRIIVNPKNNNQVFASSNYGLYRSDNGGTTWTDIGASRLPNNIIMDMDYYYNESTNTFKLYLIDQVQYEEGVSSYISTGGIFVSSDNGDSFTNINGDVGIDINQLSGGVPDNFYKYINKWLGISNAATRYSRAPTAAVQTFNSLNVDPSQDNTLYIGFADAQVQLSFTPGRLWKTTNGGQHWENVSRDFAPAWEKDKAYWESRNNPWNDNMEMGHEPFFQQWGQDYPLRSLRHASVNNRGDVMIIAAHNTLLSTDGAQSFKQVDETYTTSGAIVGLGNSNLPGETMLQDKRLGSDKTLLGSGEHRLWITTDEKIGDRIALKQSESLETVSALAVHPLDENIIYQTSFRQYKKEYMYVSQDGGKTFQEWGKATPASYQMRTHSIRINPQNPDVMFFGITDKNGADANKEGGFYWSNDGGKTFNPRNNGLPANARIRDIEFDPRDTSNKSYFAAAQSQWFNANPKVNGGLYFTDNEGQSWSKVSTPIGVNGVNRITFDNTNRMYITSGHRNNHDDAGGIWYTDDYGDNWTQIFSSARTEAFDVSPFDNNLLVTTIGFLELNPGIYLSEDRGLTWKKNNIDGLNTYLRDVEFDLHDPTKLWSVGMGNGFDVGKYPNGAKAQVVKIDNYSNRIKPQEQIKVNTTIADAHKNKEIVWHSSNPSIATVDNEGNVQGLKEGKVEIYATIDNRYSDYAVVVVSDKERIMLETNDANTTTTTSNTTTAIDIAIDNQYSVYPNPVNNQLFIRGNDIIASTVINYNGVVVNKQNNNQAIDFSALISGLYYVRLETNEGSRLIKVIKN